MKRKFTTEKKLVAQIRFFEELHVVKDERGETIFVGTPEMTARILKALKADRRSGKVKPKRRKRK